MANWIKYQDQNRINLDLIASIVKDANYIVFYHGDYSNGKDYFKVWQFNDEEECPECNGTGIINN